MPGIFGYSGKEHGPVSQIQVMQDSFTLTRGYIRDPIFHDPHLSAGCVHLDEIGEKTSPYNKDGIYVWVEGEVGCGVKHPYITPLTFLRFVSATTLAYRTKSWIQRHIPSIQLNGAIGLHLLGVSGGSLTLLSNGTKLRGAFESGSGLT